MVAVCDAFDAMTTDRPYRKRIDEREALEELKRCAGTQFDAAVVEAFDRVLMLERRRAAEAASADEVAGAPADAGCLTRRARRA